MERQPHVIPNNPGLLPPPPPFKPFRSKLIKPPDNNDPRTPVELAIKKSTESCVFKIVMSGVAGSAIGLMFGLLFVAYASVVDKAVHMEEKTIEKVHVGVREAWRAMASRVRNFSRFGMVFSAAECTIRSVRDLHDMLNYVIGGCAAGAIIATAPFESMTPRARATKIAYGCVSVGAFSASMEGYMYRDKRVHENDTVSPSSEYRVHG